MNDLFYKIILLLTFLGVITSIIIKFVIYHRSKNVFQEMKIILGKGDIFFPLYSYFKNQPFPIVSTTMQKKNPSENNQTYEKKILNVAFPDTLINYNVASFDSDSTVNIATNIPLDDIYFFSITIYLENGKVYKSLNNSIFETKTGTLNHTFLLKPSAEETPDDSTITIIRTPPKEMSPTYCVILRTYRKKITTTLFDPTLSVNDKELEYKSITPQKREENSNVIQTLLYFLFHLKLSKINVQTFFDVDAYKFFLPADNRMGLVFPNPFAKYLMCFPQKKNNYVLRIQGKLQNNIGEENSTVSYVSFMASNFVKTSTDNSLMFKDIIMSTKGNGNREYWLYVAFSEEDAIAKGYKKENGDNLLLWDASNTSPCLIYRIVSISNDYDEDNKIFNTSILNTETKSIGNENSTLTSWKYYPNIR